MWTDGILGQTLAKGLLGSALKQDRLAQSYLFYGPEGVGKAHVAKRLAMAVQCDTGFGIGCGSCAACTKLLRDTHPDFHMIYPEGNNIRIDQVRALQGIMSRRPHQGRRRIAVFDPADKLNEPAANALLKLLEEPPEDSLLILISENSAKLLPTIRSRCMPLRFSALSQQELKSALPQGLAEPMRHLTLAAARGSLGELLRLCSQSDWLEDRQNNIAWYLEEPGWGMWERLKFAEEREAQWRERSNWQNFLQNWQALSRDRLMLALGVSDGLLNNPDFAKELKGMPTVDKIELQKRITGLGEALQQLAAYTTPRLIVESVLLSWMA